MFTKVNHAVAGVIGLIAFAVAARFAVRNKEQPRWKLLAGLMASFLLAALVGRFADRLTQGASLEAMVSPNVIYFILMGGIMFWAAIQFSFLGIIFFLITLCNILTVSKGAWVGYTAGFIAFLMLVLLYFSQFQSEKMRRALRTGAIVALAFGVLGVGVVSFQRVDSLRFRVCTWISTFEMGNTHPLFGNGIGSFRVLYPAYRRPQIFHIEGKHNTETDHAEDEYWEVFQDEGIVGFGIFIWVIVAFSVMGIRSLQRFTEGLSIKDLASGKRKVSDDPRAYYMLGILAAFWGMLIHNAMDVSLRFVSSGIFIWLLAGLIGAMTIHDPMREKDVPLDADPEPVPASSPLNTTGGRCRCGWPALGLFGVLTYHISAEICGYAGRLSGSIRGSAYCGSSRGRFLPDRLRRVSGSLSSWASRCAWRRDFWFSSLCSTRYIPVGVISWRMCTTTGGSSSPSKASGTTPCRIMMKSYASTPTTSWRITSWETYIPIAGIPGTLKTR